MSDLAFCAYCKRWNDFLALNPQPCTNTKGHDFVSDLQSVLRQIRRIALLSVLETTA